MMHIFNRNKLIYIICLISTNLINDIKLNIVKFLLFVKYRLPSSQRSPVYSGGQSHLNLAPSETHEPPFLHGLGRQGLPV